MPEFRRLLMIEIDPPDLPMRATMDDVKLRELADDLQLRGLLQPIVVVKLGEGESNTEEAAKSPSRDASTPSPKKYRIIAGHRRFIAADMIHWTEIDTRVYERGEINEVGAMVSENLNREDINDGQMAIFLHQLSDVHGWSEEQICKALNKSPDWVGDRYRMLDGDPGVFTELLNGTISIGQARALNRFKDDTWRNYYLDQAVRNSVTVKFLDEARRQAEANPIGQVATPAKIEGNGHAPEVPPQQQGCIICGGNMDWWNLEYVLIHKHELEQLRKLLSEAAPA